MCGIVGVARIGTGKPVEPERLLRMRETLRHRGPDDAGIWLHPDGGVGLAHRRLAILDLSEAGRQPMHDVQADTWITYNGEIYNYLELREALQRRGHRFRTDTDTEVLLVAYREWGEACLTHLNGMFAFALYDRAADTLVLARDRMGKKPLYYSLAAGQLLLASEPKALLTDAAVSRDLDLRAVNFFLAYGYIPGDLSVFRSIRKLPPGQALRVTLSSGQTRRWSYWTLPEAATAGETGDDAALLDELQALFEDAVRIRLRSDVPLGVFLSGGLDSSLVVAMTSRLSSRPVETFTIGFDESERDERSYATIVAQHFGTHHHELVIRPDVFGVLPELVRQYDEPFADPSLIPTFYVCREARRSMTVALAGDGGDDVFGGYRRYQAALRDAHLMRYMPAGIRRWVASSSRLLPRGGRYRAYAQRLGDDTVAPFIARRQLFDQPTRRRLLTDSVLAELGAAVDEPERHLRSCFAQTAHRDFVTRMIATDFQTYLPDDILVKVDRASMAVSLEVRAPLLDFRLAEFAFARLPGRLKVHGGGKVILRKLGERLLPQELPLHRKAGFGIPLRRWVGKKDSEWVSSTALAGTGLFAPRAVDEIVQAAGTGLAAHDRRVFALLVFDLWHQTLGEKPCCASD